MKFLYNFDTLFPENKSPENVVPLTLECYDVRPAGRTIVGTNSWTFKVVGRGDEVFSTSYDWSLVEASPENLAIVHEVKELHKQAGVLQNKASSLFAKVKIITTPQSVAA